MTDLASQNRLGSETSPYLLQHRDNPVDWWAWGPDALAHARETGKPILLSVGYAACHWCHVMAHESFEDEQVAAVMNDLFVNIKVDREERPDVDSVYMSALQELGEQGGWPLTMFLTSDGEPFWGGTYFPKEPRYGRPGFVTVLQEVARIYAGEPARVRQNADAIKGRLQPAPPRLGAEPPNDAILAELARRFAEVIDPVNGGLRGAPKFPQTNLFGFLWRAGLRYGVDEAKQRVILTLTRIAQGGIYDHLGGGFARYAVDERWLVPHFEKMLYDNALLLGLMSEVWRETKLPLFAQRAEETVGWLLREMTVEGGGFASSLDADSEGEEGKFYVWSKAEIEAALGAEDAAIFAAVYDVSEEGNFEGKCILNRLDAPELGDEASEAKLAEMRAKLLAIRDERVRPGFDDKVLADWNGLMIASLTRAGDAFAKPEWTDASKRAFDFVCTRMEIAGRLNHAFREGETKAPASAADYAHMIGAALALADVTGEAAYVAKAKAWVDVLDAHYWADELGGYYFAADDTDDLIVRPLSAHDDATPNANPRMTSHLMALYMRTGETRYLERAEKILAFFSGAAAENPLAHSGLLDASIDVLAPSQVVFIAPEGKDADSLRGALRDVSLPGAVIERFTDGEVLPEGSPAAGKTALDGKPTAYVCIGPQCAAPVTEGTDLIKTIKSARKVEA
ncbi:thioredoxin domain-containing protein [Methyloligella sp. GL2]|uniref:thioredoxin domain-containing protein n=2 Tax=unclassified Methyloligella TaxID=2625955 RepID=UPI00157D7EA9|nr:thioredoxin domain-containing protein [Methyloligella sp. GL2]QKP76270.1 thioredoxin domain-containing protein [Methyloligella sp. GL2]